MEFNSGQKDKTIKNVEEVKKLSMEQYKARLNKEKYGAKKPVIKFLPIKKLSLNRNKKADSLSDRDIKDALQENEVIPGLQDDSGSNQESSGESSTEKIFLAATEPRDCLKRKNSLVEEPEILTLSSDEDESCEDSSRGNTMICKKEPIITYHMTFPPHPDSLESGCSSQCLSVGCRTIRVGSHKFVPTGTVSFSRDSLKFSAPLVDNADQQVSVHIPLACVVKILCSLEPGLTSIFIYLTPPFASHVRQKLHMMEDGNAYFDPCSSDESKKRLIMFIDRISETLIVHFRRLYKNRRTFLNCNLIEELSKDEVNAILIGSAPMEVRPLIRATIAPLSPPCKTLLIYPAQPTKGRITINVGDYECLAEEQFLNDVVIDFYLKWLHLEKLPDIYRARTHVFSTFFYKRLTAKPNKASRNDPHEVDTRLRPAEKRHARVKSWTKGLNIFEKDFVLIPINKRSHWFMAVICFPGVELNEPEAVTPEETTPTRKSTRPRTKTKEHPSLDLDWSDRDEAESDEELNGVDEFRDGKLTKKEGHVEKSCYVKNPCILIFDSMRGSDRSSVVSTLREYLEVEYAEKHTAKRKFTKDNMFGFLPQVPQQMNYSDCGVYTLQFAESFFDDPIKNYKLPMRSLEDWFPQEMVIGKRESIAILIQSLVRQADNPNRHPIPLIKFPSKKKPLIAEPPHKEESNVRSPPLKKNALDCELQSNDFKPISFQASKCLAKKISLNLSSKTIASSKDMRAELNKHCSPRMSASLQMIKSSYEEESEDTNVTQDDDIYGDLELTEESYAGSSSSTDALEPCPKRLKLSPTESSANSNPLQNKFRYQVPR